MFNEGNQIHNFMSSSGSGTVINYGSDSGSDFLTSYGWPVPVPLVKKLRFLRFRFRFHNTGLRMSHICPCTPCLSPQGYRSKVEIRHFAHHRGWP
jgi:hypothetical protein